jgi:hypothetical protein
MIALVLALLLALVTPAHAIIIIGGTGAPPDAPPATCETQSYDVEFTTTNTYSVFETGQERGQSWTAVATGSMYALWLKANDGVWSGATITIRIGTSSNLSASYLSEFTCVVPDAEGWFQCLAPDGGRPSLTASTTYYALFRTSALWNINRDSAGGYANGTAYYDLNKDWIGTTSSSDLPFKIEICD